MGVEEVEVVEGVEGVGVGEDWRKKESERNKREAEPVESFCRLVSRKLLILCVRVCVPAVGVGIVW